MITLLVEGVVCVFGLIQARLDHLALARAGRAGEDRGCSHPPLETPQNVPKSVFHIRTRKKGVHLRWLAPSLCHFTCLAHHYTKSTCIFIRMNQMYHHMEVRLWHTEKP